MQVNEVPHYSKTASGLSLQPGSNGQVFAATCHDILRIFDIRSNSTGRPMIEITQSRNPQLLWSVGFSPCEANQVATSGSKVGTHLFDIRFPAW